MTRGTIWATALCLLVCLMLPGCATPQARLRAEYQRGYEEGRREEAEKYKGIDIELAKQMIGDTQRSQGHILDMVNGRVAKMEIIRVDNNGQTAIVEVGGYYHDGTKIDGVLEFIYKDGFWYLIKSFQTGTRSTSGLRTPTKTAE